ncbi:MAG: ATP-binding cassette domain-containing protein, partial [Alphaproteobacteria bacterium]
MSPSQAARAQERAEPLLAVRDLEVTFDTDEGPLRAVDGASFSIARGTTFALVGESGCGKTVTALACLGLIPPAGAVTGGQI